MSDLAFQAEDTGVPDACWTRQVSMEDRWVLYGDTYDEAHTQLKLDGWLFVDPCDEGPESEEQMIEWCVDEFGAGGQAIYDAMNQSHFPYHWTGPQRSHYLHAHMQEPLGAPEVFGYWYATYTFKAGMAVLIGGFAEKMTLALSNRSLLRMHQHCVAKCIQNLLGLDNRGRPSEV